MDGGSALKKGPYEPANRIYNLYHPALTDHQGFLRDRGMEALHPTQLNYDQHGGPSIWGNPVGFDTILQNLDKDKRTGEPITGPDRESVYYINGSFIVVSVRQYNYWKNDMHVNMDLIGQEK